MAGDNQKWSVKGSISIPTLLSISAAVISVVLWLSDIRTEVSVLSKAHAEGTKTQIERDNRQDLERAEMRRMWREDMRLIHEKLDRLLTDRR